MSHYKSIGIKSTFKPPQPWVFRPVLAFRLKMYLFYLLSAVVCYVILLAIFLFNFTGLFLNYLLIGELFGFLVLSCIIGFALNKYFRSFEYQVHGTEIIIKKGLINKTEFHIPFSNITNIAIRKGPFDQIFGIGSIIVYTAGQTVNPLRITSITGIKIYEDVCYFVLNQIKTYESFLSYLTGFQPLVKSQFDSEFWNDFLKIVSEIKKNISNN